MHYDLAIIGSGSGNSIVDDRFAGQRVAMIEAGVFGGTCLNVGCIPTKMFVLPADLASSPDEAARLGVDLSFIGADWPAIRDRVFGRIDPISAGGEAYRRDAANIDLYRSKARFTGERRIAVETGEEFTADRVVIAAGSRTRIPTIPGIDDITVHTSDTVMRLDRLPRRVLIMGGGFVAAEFAHVFAAFGVEVVVVNRSDALLQAEDDEITARFTRSMSRRAEVHLDTSIEAFEPLDDDRVRARLGDGTVTEVDVVLIAIGRIPNGDTLDLATAGVETGDGGYVVVDDQQRTTADGVFALGDVSSPWQLKHVANHEMRVVQHNLLHPDAMISSDHRFVPHAVFTEPQIAAVGLTERQARDAGLDVRVVVQEYGTVAYGWALEDTEHCCKLIADRATGQLVGAHLIGPQAATLIQPLIQAMSFGLAPHDMARGQYWVHPALPEVIENALLSLDL